MEIRELKLKGTYEILLKPNFDERGFFMRTYDEAIFRNADLNFKWVQENCSKSIKRNIIRGLHCQLPPFSETKFVRCTKGAVFDVFVDLRSGSNTFGEWDGIELSESNFLSVIIPRGFAHGFCTLTEEAEIVYKVDNFYSPSSECGILWNDEIIKIDWPVSSPFLSEKDKKNFTLSEFISKYSSL